jgi:rsbT antagonist protein RsbS
MERIPIIKMAEFLLVSIQVDMHDKLALTLQDDLTNQIVKSHTRGVLIDISSLEIVDSFIGRMLANIAAMSKVLDAETVVVGMRPAVAITLVELGMSLTGVRTALSVERGMALLREALGEPAAVDGVDANAQD